MIGIFGVFETHGREVPGCELGGLGVVNLISSFDITLSGSNRAILIHRKPADILFSADSFRA
jgi:hypothetical protein